MAAAAGPGLGRPDGRGDEGDAGREGATDAARPPPEAVRRRAGRRAFLALATLAPPSFLPSLTVFVLAVVIGFYVIGNVHHALHTPLMSVTNAISGIIVVGAVLQAPVDNLAVQIIAGVAILLASINVFGGFLVTRRMLNMFQKG